jgi:hypothetical protein
MKIAHIFMNVDMRNGHSGLKEFCKDKRVKITPDDFIVFVNSTRTMMKVFCKGSEAIMHLKKDGHKLDLGIIKYLPKYCDGPEIDIDKAIADNIKDVMKRKKGNK